MFTQFRLRTLFVFIACAAVVCYFWSNVERDERCRVRATLELHAHGVLVTGHLYTVSMTGPTVTDERFLSVAHLIAECGGPKNLELYDAHIGIASLREIGKLPNLENLGLIGAAIDDDGVAMLSRLPRLSDLSLTDTQVSDACVPALCSMRRLSSVSLGATRVTAKGIAILRAARPGLEIDWRDDWRDDRRQE